MSEGNRDADDAGRKISVEDFLARAAKVFTVGMSTPDGPAGRERQGVRMPVSDEDLAELLWDVADTLDSQQMAIKAVAVREAAQRLGQRAGGREG